MNKSTMRATAVVGTTMALVMAGAAAVAAAGPHERDDFRGFGGQRMGGESGFGGMRGGPDMGGMGLGFGGMRGLDSDIERAEHTIQTADGTTAARVEQGVVDSAAADSLTFSLASGEAVTVAIDEDTQSVAFEEQEVTSRRGWTRTQLVPSEIEVADIAAGAEIIVWSDSEEGADFVASRVMLKPADPEAAEDADAVDATDDATAEETSEEVAATDA